MVTTGTSWGHIRDGEPYAGESVARSYHYAVLLLLPALLLWIHPSLFINPGGNDLLDPWVYTGLFLSLPEHIQHFGETYYSSRLPWLLPGFLAQKLFTPVAGNYALHLSFFYALLFATYAMVSSGINRRAAFAAAVFAAWCPTILTAMSWDYVDGGGLAFLMIALCCLERATGAPAFARTWWSMAAGAALACLVGSNLTLFALLPACAVFVMVRATASRWRSIVLILTFAVVGATILVAALGVVNRSMGGQWLFFEPSIRFAMLIRNEPNRWRTADFNWNQATWLALPAYAAISAIVALVVRRKIASSFERAAESAMVVAAATWVLLDLRAGFALLQYAYYTSYLAPLAIVAVMAQTSPPRAGRSLSAVRGLEIGTLLAVAGIHWLMFWHGAGFWRFWIFVFASTHLSNAAVAITVLTTAFGLTAVLALEVVRSPPWRWAAFVLGITLSFAGLAQYWPTAPGPDGPAQFENTVRAHRFIAQAVTGRAFRIWHVPPTPGGPPFRSIACTFLCNKVLVNEDLPRFTAAEALVITPAVRLVMLVNNETEAREARASLLERGLDYTVVTQQQFGGPDRMFLVIVANVASVPRPA